MSCEVSISLSLSKLERLLTIGKSILVQVTSFISVAEVM